MVDDWADMSEDDQLVKIRDWPRWYQENFTKKALRDFFHEYASGVVSKEDAALLRASTPWISELDCAYARMISRGYAHPRLVKHLTEKKIPLILSGARNDVATKEAGDLAMGKKITKVVVGEPYKASIQERISEQVGQLLGVVDAEVDAFLANKCKKSKFSMSTYLKKNQVKGPHTRAIVEYLNTIVDELKELLSGDDQLDEGYAFLSKAQRQKYYDFMKGMLDDAKQWQSSVKSKRKPRAKKIKTAEERTSKMKYKEEDTDLKIKGLVPADIVNARQVWIYNTKDRFLFVYTSNYGLNVKGSTILRS